MTNASRPQVGPTWYGNPRGALIRKPSSAVTRSVRRSVVLLEAKDEAAGAGAEPTRVSVLLKDGVGKIDFKRDKPGEVTQRPKISWTLVGWWPLAQGVLEL